jgi:hypothetical protein
VEKESTYSPSSSWATRCGTQSRREDVRTLLNATLAPINVNEPSSSITTGSEESQPVVTNTPRNPIEQRNQQSEQDSRKQMQLKATMIFMHYYFNDELVQLTMHIPAENCYEIWKTVCDRKERPTISNKTTHVTSCINAEWAITNHLTRFETG